MKTLLGDFDWVKLFNNTLKLKISHGFLDCMNVQLTQQFVNATESKLANMQRLSLPFEKQPDIEYGEVSSIPATLFLPQAVLDIKIAWRAKSGRIYQMGDEDIDCNDLEFWFLDLDLEKCKKLDRLPDQKLIMWEHETEYLVNGAKKEHNLQWNEIFFDCANKPISAFFEERTGIKINKHIKLTTLLSDYETGEVSKLGVYLHVGASSYRNTIQLCWKSKSGKIYDLADESFDCDDIVFWLEGLQPATYLEQLYPYSSPPLPFKLKNLSYKLTVKQIVMDCEMLITLKQEAIKDAESLLEGIYNFINDYNETSEKKNRKQGVIHNARGVVDNNKITLTTDIGSVGPDFFKKLFNYLSSLNAFEEVIVD